ncbi:radical SAM protein [Methylomonas sp. UP202]|uniref:radical SAM protein n=1 Tax=Methylomonas sp. UP202 TaxID=3040943 RepID=UPI002478CE6E|nr:radical SAM protein [Methylomonas sp. UP202]WGS87300.1 radical SAM protein [Methylomonas sp. UP202]
MVRPLTTANHDRDSAGLKYVYPVMSRRAGGLSLGINFNPNNACNWRCVYCQVPNLTRGAAPTLDFEVLERELRGFLEWVLRGDFFDAYDVAAEQRVVKDIAISGNGEPTSLKSFDRAIRLIGEIGLESGILPTGNLVLISNGSLVHQKPVQAGLAELANCGGELWFKLDSATSAGRNLLNHAKLSQAKLIEHLQIASDLCPTKLQTCFLHYRQAWSEAEKAAYLALLAELKSRNIKIAKILLYSLARPSLQPEAGELRGADLSEMTRFAADIEALGYDVGVSL